MPRTLGTLALALVAAAALTTAAAARAPAGGGATLVLDRLAATADGDQLLVDVTVDFEAYSSDVHRCLQTAATAAFDPAPTIAACDASEKHACIATAVSAMQPFR